MFNSIFDTMAAGLSIQSALICAGMAILLGAIISLTHMFTSRCSKNFLVALAVLPLLVMAVMIMINGNLGTSIAILGAFSLIRFRSIQGDAKELLSIFFTMTIGLALGMGHVLFSIVVTAIAVCAIVFFSKTNFLAPNPNDRILKIVIPEDMDYDEAFSEIFQKYTAKSELVKMKTVNMGSLYKLTYDVTLRRGIKEKDFLDEIRVKNCNLKVLLSHSNLEKEM